MTLRRGFLCTAVVALTLSTVSAFVPPQSASPRLESIAVYGNTKIAPPMPVIRDISYGEESRKYRRTVYSHDDWRKHRSQDRFIYYLRSMFSSGVYKNLGREVTATTAVATFVCLYNSLAGGYVDFEGVKHVALLQGGPILGLPLAAFTLTSPSLGLLLVFRTNTGYQRWDEARKNWGMNINHTR